MLMKERKFNCFSIDAYFYGASAVDTDDIDILDLTQSGIALAGIGSIGKETGSLNL